MPIHDECYQALNIRSYEISPLAMLTFYIGSLWCGLFGDTLISLRELMLTQMLFSIFLGCGYFYCKTRDLLITSFLFMTMSLLSVFSTLFIFGWDIGAYPFIVMSLLSVLNYVKEASLKSVVLVGVFCALMVLSKITTIAILPILLAIIIWRANKVSCVKISGVIMRDSLVGVASFLVTALIVIAVMCGVENYIEAWNPENIITGHDANLLIISLFKLFPNVFKMWLFVGLLALLSILISRMKRRIFKYSLLSLAFVVSCIFLRYAGLNSGLAQGLFLVLLFYLPALKVIRHEVIDVPVSFLMIVCAFSLMSAVGSDGAFEKPLVIPMIPIIATTVYKYRNGMLKWIFILVAALSFQIDFVRLISLHRNHIYKADIPRLTSLHLNSEKAPLYNSVKELTDSLKSKGQKIVFWGNSKYYFEYFFHDDTPPLLQMFHYDDNKEEMVRKVETTFMHYDVVIIQWNNYDPNNYYNIIKSLQQKGFVSERRDDKFWILYNKNT